MFLPHVAVLEVPLSLVLINTWLEQRCNARVGLGVLEMRCALMGVPCAAFADRREPMEIFMDREEYHKYFNDFYYGRTPKGGGGPWNLQRFLRPSHGLCDFQVTVPASSVFRSGAGCEGVYFDHHHFSHQLCHRRAHKHPGSRVPVARTYIAMTDEYSS